MISRSRIRGDGEGIHGIFRESLLVVGQGPPSDAAGCVIRSAEDMVRIKGVISAWSKKGFVDFIIMKHDLWEIGHYMGRIRVRVRVRVRARARARARARRDAEDEGLN